MLSSAAHKLPPLEYLFSRSHRSLEVKAKLSANTEVLAQAYHVGIIENPPPAFPPPRFDAAADRFGALLLDEAPPLPDALEPPSEVVLLEVLPLALHFCFLGLAAVFLPVAVWDAAACELAAASCEFANFWLKAWTRGSGRK
jgi:hypothetical protein